jgi:hypothetical protein
MHLVESTIYHVYPNPLVSKMDAEFLESRSDFQIQDSLKLQSEYYSS